MKDYNCCCYRGLNKDLSQILIPWNKVQVSNAGEQWETGFGGQDHT